MEEEKKVNTESVKKAKKTELEYKGTVYNCERVRVRKSPDVTGEVLTMLEKGTKVKVNQKESTVDYYKVYDPQTDVEGYCHKNFIDVKAVPVKVKEEE